MATRQLRPSPEPLQPHAYGYCRVSTDQQRKIEGRCLENGGHLQEPRAVAE